MFEKLLISQCSPTLASIKTANLFTVCSISRDDAQKRIDHWNSVLAEKSVTLILLRYSDSSALIYVCRKSMLQADLNKPGVGRFLSRCGYSNTDVDYCIEMLKKRLETCDSFPHEIGLFLGYPLGDVIGFIKNAGRNSKCIGCWKVYCNECEAKKTFNKFKKCKSVYQRLWSEGRSVIQLTVAA